MRHSVTEYGKLFLAFARVGVMTFGGGYAMLPILQREIVDKHGWATEDELMDYYAIGQCTPGIIAVNTATFVGYRYLGTIGGILATLGVVFPSIIIITLIALFLRNFAEIALVQHAFNGIRACVVVLIAEAVWKLAKKALPDGKSIVLYLIVLALSLFTPVSNVILIVLAGVAGVITTIRTGNREGGKTK